VKIPAWAWITWLAIGLGLETVALYNAAPGDTFTEYTVAAGLSWLAVGFGLWLARHFKQ
jgi:hypothetical protein